jgi:sterol desaturase/sphingolipid hydroxylase (fatty acid hydroxylase superfamily)
MIWGVPSLVLGVAFVTSTLLLSVQDMEPSTWYLGSLITAWRSETRSAAVLPSRLARMLPVVLRNIMLTAVVIYLSWNLRAVLFPAQLTTSFDARWDVVTGGWWSWMWWPLRVFVQVAALKFFSQLWFFKAHRWVHSNEATFRYVHAMHHQHAEPVALTAIHCTMSEMLLLNIPAAIFGPLVLVPDFVPHCVWMLLVGLYTPVAHSGHNFGGLIFDAQFHDDHHRYLNVNYGSVRLDRLFGTHADSHHKKAL